MKKLKQRNRIEISEKNLGQGLFLCTIVQQKND